MRIFVAALIFLYPHIMLANDWRGVYQSSVESIPFIDSAGATCSGVLVSEDRILTAWHCVGLMRSIKVKWKATDKADEREAVTIYKDEDHDIAILKLNSPVKRRSLLLANSGSAQEGLPICTIGHPMSRDEKANLAFSISAGVISKINKDNMVTDPDQNFMMATTSCSFTKICRRANRKRSDSVAVRLSGKCCSSIKTKTNTVNLDGRQKHMVSVHSGSRYYVDRKNKRFK